MQKILPVLVVLVLVIGGAVFVSQNYSKTNTPQYENSPVGTPAATLDTTSKNTSTPSSSPVTTTTKSSRVMLDSVSPSSANSGDEVRLLGSYFGTLSGKVNVYKAGSDKVYAEVEPNRWTDSEIKITVPAASGNQKMDMEVVHKDGTKSNKVSFTVKLGQPAIDTISPTGARTTQEITIAGKEFGSKNGSINIYNKESKASDPVLVTCPISSWSDSVITCKLPSTLTGDSEYNFEIVSSDERRGAFKLYRLGS